MLRPVTKCYVTCGNTIFITQRNNTVRITVIYHLTILLYLLIKSIA